MEIHIQLAGIELGPYSEKQIRDYLADGLLSLEDKARIDGSEEWINVTELMTKLPPPAPEPPQPPADAIFIPEVEPPVVESKREPEAADGITPVPTRVTETGKPSFPAAADAGAKKTIPIGPSAPLRSPTKGMAASASNMRTAPLAQGTKKLSATALAKALAAGPTPAPSPTLPAASAPGKTAPIRAISSPAPAIPEPPPPTMKPVPEDAEAPAGTSPVDKKRGGRLSSLLRSLTAKTVPMRPTPPQVPESAMDTTSPIPPTSLAPPISPLAQPLPQSRSTIPITAPLPTRPVPASPPEPAPPILKKSATEPTIPAGSSLTQLQQKNWGRPSKEEAKKTEEPKIPEIPKKTQVPTKPEIPAKLEADKPIPKADLAKEAEAPAVPAPDKKKAAKEAKEREKAEALEKKKEKEKEKEKAREKKKEDEKAKKAAAAEADGESGEEPSAKRKSQALIYAIGALAILLVYYVWSPYHAAGLLRNALATGDDGDLAATIDFPAVQNALKQQIANTPGTDAATRSAIDMINQSVDLYVTPEGVSYLVNKRQPLQKEKMDQAISPGVATSLLARLVNLPSKNGFSSATDFVLQTDAGLMHLHFQGYRWRLTRVELRPDLTGPATVGGISPFVEPALQTLLDRGNDHLANSESATSPDLKGRELGEAIADFSQVLSIHPKSADALEGRAAARQARGDFDGAIKDYNAALATDPQRPSAYNGRGNARAAEDDFDGAIADFTEAVHLDPALASAYHSRGNAKTAKVDFEGAISDFTQALAIDPKMASAYSDRGFARQANHNLDGAISDYTQALALVPNTAVAYYNRGLARQSQGNFDAAIIDYDKALAFNPKLASAYYSRGTARNATRDLDGAIADYTQALTFDPKLAVAFRERGLAHDAKGDTDDALSDYSHALDLDPKDAVAYFRRGVIKAQKNDLDGAIADSSQALDLDPKNSQALYNRGFAKLARGNLDGATDDLKAFCADSPHDAFADHARLYLWLIGRAQNAKTDVDQDLSTALEATWNSPADDLTTQTASFLLGRTTEGDYLNSTSSPVLKTDQAQHCEAWYFAGMKRLLMGDKATAVDYFHRSVATGKSNFCEYILAEAELKNLEQPTASAMTAPTGTPPTQPQPKLP